MIYPSDFMAVDTSSTFPGAQISFAPIQTIYTIAIIPTQAKIQYCISWAIPV